MTRHFLIRGRRAAAAGVAAVFLTALSSTAFGVEAVPDATTSEAASEEYFEKKIRPILVSHCYNCHSADTKPAGGLRVDDYKGILAGGDAGPGIVPGDPDKSLILRRIRHEDPKRRMPKEGDPLTDTQIADLAEWIKQGAVWPKEKLPSTLGKERPKYAQLRTNHWAWQPLVSPKVPVVKDAQWPKDDLDRFILAKLEEKILRPVTDADAVTLIRRVTFDLTGLPPTPAEIEAFRKDKSKDALEKVVDRLLASPHFGERWGRNWLDVARYGESTGPSRNIPYPHAWKYRDYVIDAINRDIPFDQFVREQIAGDLLPSTSTAERDRQLTATGFLALGVKDVNQRFKTRFIMDNVAEQVDTVTRSVLGLTVSCARCHDHKTDPIPTADYYALAGIFTSTDDCAGVRNKMGGGGLDYYDSSMLVLLTADIPKAPADQVAKLEAEVAETKKAWDAIRGTPEGLKIAANGQPTQRPLRLKYEKAQGELLALTDPAARGFAVHGVRESKAIADTEIRIRGEAERLGPIVPRGFLTTFNVPETPVIPADQSGRLQLAQWMTSPANPLTPRVVANRVWAHLFGRGIVSTVDNFGVTGDVPTHPELLDHLADRFIRDGWSIKQLVRTLVLSRSYQLGSDSSEVHRIVDPANHWVWRHSPRRLDTEEIRDAMLASAGNLKLTPPEGSAVKQLKMIEMRDNGGEARNIRQESDQANYRSLYLPALRGVVPSTLEAFDPVEQTLVTGKRETTTVPTQSLYLLNSAFVRQQSLSVAEHLLKGKSKSDVERIRQAYLLTLGRPANADEVKRAQKFIASYASDYADAPPVEPVILVAKVEKKVDADAEKAVPANPDDVERSDEIPEEIVVRADDAKAAAWQSFVQALYASAEFRFVR